MGGERTPVSKPTRFGYFPRSSQRPSALFHLTRVRRNRSRRYTRRHTRSASRSSLFLFSYLPAMSALGSYFTAALASAAARASDMTPNFTLGEWLMVWMPSRVYPDIEELDEY